MSVDFVAHAEALKDEVTARRRDLHQHPELAFQEVRTAGIVADELRQLGLEVQTGVGKTGVVGILDGAHDGPTVLVRADMDALPITEETALPFTSQNPAIMHSCGHDGHTAIALGVAKLFAPLREEIAGRIKFVFQPAEEIGRGAEAMAADGVLNDPRPDVSVGLHLWNSLPLGTLGVAEGPTMAGAAILNIHITGKGGHAASPHLTIDPVICAAHLTTALQTIVSRNLDPFDAAVITVAKIVAGDTHNVIPQTAYMEGTIRYFRPEVMTLVERRLHELVPNVARGLGCEAEVIITPMTPPVFNNAEVNARLRPAFARIVGEDKLDNTIRTMGAEDVGTFMTETPGMYFFLGAKDETAPAYYPHHHPRFTFDERALPLGVALLSAAVGTYVLPEA